MKDNETKEIAIDKVWLNALKTFGKIMLCLIVLYFFVIMSIYFLNPKLAAGMFNSMNLKNAEESCLEMEYNQNQTPANLYNLVVFESGQGNYQKELQYINMLLVNKEYDEFCEKMDKSALSATTNKNLIALNSNVNSYILNQKVKCMYNLGISKQSILSNIRTTLSKAYMPEYTFSTFVELIISDKTLSVEDKRNLLNSMLLEDGLNSLASELDAKIEKLEILAESQTSKNNEIVYRYSLLGNLRGKYLAYLSVLDDGDEKLIETKQAYETAFEKYNKLINN